MIGKPAERFDEVRLHLYVRGLSPKEAFRGSGDNLALSPTLATPVETPFSFATWLPLCVDQSTTFCFCLCFVRM